MKNIAVNHYLVLGVSTLLAIIVAGCTQLSEADQHFNAGLELYEQGHLQEAIAEYDQAIQTELPRPKPALDPRAVSVRSALAGPARAQGRR